MATPTLLPPQRRPGDGCWSSHSPTLRQVQPEMNLRGCTCIKGQSPGQSTRGLVTVGALAGGRCWSTAQWGRDPGPFLPPCNVPVLVLGPAAHPGIRLPSGSSLPAPPRLLPGAPPALLRPPQPREQATPLPSHAPQPLPGSNNAPASQAARLGSQCRDGSLPAPPTPLFLWFWKSLQSLLTQVPTLPLAALSQALELWELGQPHFRA